MPSNTAAKKLPYPLPAEPASAGAEAIRKLAQSVDNMIQTGIATLPTAASSGGNSDFALVFPLAFQTAPLVFLTSLTTAPDQVFASVVSGTVTTAGCTIRGRRPGGTNGWDVQWVAIGPINAVA